MSAQSLEKESAQSLEEEFPGREVYNVMSRSYACVGASAKWPPVSATGTFGGKEYRVKSAVGGLAGSLTACCIPPTGPIRKCTVRFSNHDIVGLSIHPGTDSTVWAHINMSNGERLRCSLEGSLVPERINNSF